MSIDVVQAVRDGKGKFEWYEVVREHNGYKLFISVFRDAMKFDGIPALTWDFKPASRWDAEKRLWLPDDRIFDGVRLPATAEQLQQIADLLDCMFLVPLVIEEIWLQAELKFDAVLNTADKQDPSNSKKRIIVANSDIHRVHEAIERKIAKLGGDDETKLISCVGKYWCLINLLHGLKVKGLPGSCNFGWFQKRASGGGVTGRVQCWQRPGYKHSFKHFDPSQTIRLMYRWARLVKPDGAEEMVDLRELAKDKVLAPLLNHLKGPLTYLRQEGVEKLEPLNAGVITLPEVTIYGSPPSS